VKNAELILRNNYFVNIAALFFDKAGKLPGVGPVPTSRSNDDETGRQEPALLDWGL